MTETYLGSSFPILETVPNPKPGDRVAFMGNTGEGKTITAAILLLAQPNAIVVNTKHDPMFQVVGETIYDDNAIMRVEGGRYNYCPSDAFLKNMAYRERFFEWCINAGKRAIYIDEINDICPNAKLYPFMLQKCVKQGRWRKLGIWVSSQEPVRAPPFLFSQAQHRYLYYLGWGDYKDVAEEWFECDIDWSLIPERSHKFLLKTPQGVFGPQPPIEVPQILQPYLSE